MGVLSRDATFQVSRLCLPLPIAWKEKLVMLPCPNCQKGLPLVERFGLRGSVVCPHCSSELQLKTWILVFLSVVPVLTINFFTGVLRAIGLAPLPAFLTAVGVSIIVAVLLHVVLARYQVKPRPPSITRTQ